MHILRHGQTILKKAWWANEIVKCHDCGCQFMLGTKGKPLELGDPVDVEYIVKCPECHMVIDLTPIFRPELSAALCSPSKDTAEKTTTRAS